MTESTVWIDPDGVTWPLEVDWDVSGRFMPRVEYVADGVPGMPGEFFRDVRHGVREFMLSVDMTGATESVLRATLRSFVASMDPTRGAGRIRVTSPIADQREILCRYSAGLEMEERLGDSGPTWQRVGIKFIAHDPYWSGVSPVSSPAWTVSDAPNFFPILPINLTASELVVDEIVTNDGDVDAWPVWTITGPGSLVKLVNNTTGQTTYFPAISIGVGETVTIDTRPGVKSVLLNNGTNLYPLLDPTSALWPLQRGTNSVRLEMSGIDSTASSLQVTYYQRYLSP